MATEKASAERSRQMALLEELKAAAEQVGLRVREERLLREVGYRVRSGRCRLRDDDVLFLDRELPPAAQLELLVEELAGHNLDTVYLSPAARALFDRVVPCEAEDDAGAQALSR